MSAHNQPIQPIVESTHIHDLVDWDRMHCLSGDGTLGVPEAPLRWHYSCQANTPLLHGLAATIILHGVSALVLTSMPPSTAAVADEEGGIVIAVTVFGTADKNSADAADRPEPAPLKSVLAPADPTMPLNEVVEPIEAGNKPTKLAQAASANASVEQVITSIVPSLSATVAAVSADARLDRSSPQENPDHEAKAAEKPKSVPRPESKVLEKSEVHPPREARVDRKSPKDTEIKEKSSKRSDASKKGEVTAKADKTVSKRASKGKAENREVGNAARSNYLGKINKALARARKSVRAPGKGVVVVSFVIDEAGTVSGLRLARSSGKPATDKAALALVRKAAPFPAIPAGIGKKSWPMKVPIEFR